MPALIATFRNTFRQQPYMLTEVTQYLLATVVSMKAFSLGTLSFEVVLTIPQDVHTPHRHLAKSFTIVVINHVSIQT
jgi:hypothetical protein